jgi:hypothetical protein
MKQWVRRNAILAQRRCMHCGLLDADTDHAETQAVNALAIDRHSECTHIIWWRSAPVAPLPFSRNRMSPTYVSERIAWIRVRYRLSGREFEAAVFLLTGMRDDGEIGSALGVKATGARSFVLRLATKMQVPIGPGRRRRLVQELERITSPFAKARTIPVEHNKGDS